MKHIFTFFAALLVIMQFSCTNKGEDLNCADLVIYGGSSAGVAAAIQAARSDNSVILIEPTNRLGGLTTGGLGQTDIGNKQVIGGISREFYQNIRKHYSDSANWNWQKKAEYRDGGQTRTEAGEDAMWTFEPSAALEVYHKMLEGLDIKIVYNQKLDRSDGVYKTGSRIDSITMETGESYSGTMFIDATYEGDLLAMAGVSYAVGRESNDQYKETLNGVQASDTSYTLSGELYLNGRTHNFVPGVDPYIIPGDPSSGLLPGINTAVEPNGTGDKRVQAYCYRMCLTDHPDNRIPFIKPEGYDENDFELLFRNYEAGYDQIPWINSSMPNKKTDTNNRDAFSTDNIGKNYNYPEASYEERERIREEHKLRQQGLMWSLANHPRVPDHIRKEVSRWGTCKDEFENQDGWQQQLYIREARRMIGDFVMTQYHCESIEVVDDPVGMAAYGMDSHHMQRYVNEKGDVENEGDVQSHVKSPYPISFRSIIPKETECSNLLVPVGLSASHIAFGSIRMEPVFMVLGQSSAIIASLAMDHKTDLHSLDYDLIKKSLEDAGQILKNR